jgi:hypothetical protein
VAAPRRTGSWARGFALLAALRAGSARADVGTGRAALPAADRVLVPVTTAPPLAVAASAGYGVTESLAGEGAHHRAVGSLAAGVGFSSHLALSLAFDGRYDRHPEGDSGAVGTPQLNLVGGVDAGSGLRLGAGLQLVLPGRGAPSLDFSASALSMTALAAWTATHGLTVAGMFGYRLDETAQAAPALERLSRADRLALGLSAFDALPFGVAVFQSFGQLDVLGELSGEWLVGKGAPAALRSPLRAALGGRMRLLPSLTGEIMLELSLSRRPSYVIIEALVPVEPRVSVGIGLRYVPDFAPRIAASPSTSTSTSTPPLRTRLAGPIVDPDGARLPGVRVSIRVAGETRTTLSNAAGEYAFDDLPPGMARVTLDGAGVVATSQELELARATMLLPLQAARAEASAQLRGLVRSFAGAPLTAVVRVAAAGRTVTADKDGRFMLELRTGEYEVEIECAGYLTQRRKIIVQDNGVTLLNVELHEAQ